MKTWEWIILGVLLFIATGALFAAVAALVINHAVMK